MLVSLLCERHTQTSFSKKLFYKAKCARQQLIQCRLQQPVKNPINDNRN